MRVEIITDDGNYETRVEVEYTGDVVESNSLSGETSFSNRHEVLLEMTKKATAAINEALRIK